MIKDSNIKKWYHNQQDHQTNRIASIFGIDYAHLSLPRGDDYYLTNEGLIHLGGLDPTRLHTKNSWFKEHAERLNDGTGCVYRVKTDEIQGCCSEIVIKWNRMGEEVPGREHYHILQDAEFNSPFEEFHLLKELQHALHSIHAEIPTQVPLAIYVPSERHADWQIGRKKQRMQSLMSSHTDIELDMNRRYMMIFTWLEGIDAAQAFRDGHLDQEQARTVTQHAADTLAQANFMVRDNKPNHIILTPKPNGGFEKRVNNQLHYGLIDYELLERTPEYKQKQKHERRKDYHRRQRDRFTNTQPEKFHPHLHHTNVLGVDYIFGNVESTKGRLWVVGNDPYLYDYFLPERWERTERTRISMFSESYRTVTKDDIHVVWEVSKVGMIPDMDPFLEDQRKILEYGYNSPFEEVALATKLSKLGIATLYPRAIYMSGYNTDIVERFFDPQRYNSHQSIIAPDQKGVLLPKHNYIIIWGHWNGPDEQLAINDISHCEGVNTLYAYREGIITRNEYLDILEQTKHQLLKHHIEDLNLSGKHLLISIDQNKQVIRDHHNKPDIRICNFEFLKDSQP